MGAQIELPRFVFCVFGVGDEVPGEERTGVVGGLAAILLEKGFLVGATLPHKVKVIGSVHLLARVVGGKLGFELGEKALCECVLKGDAVKGGAFGVAAVTGFVDEFIEIVLRTAVCGNDLQLAAPGKAGRRDGVELARVAMEGKLVEHAGAAFAGLGVGVAGERMDAGAGGEAQRL